jgi:ribonuclease PH
VEIQATAEGQSFDKDELDSLLELASGGIAKLTEYQRALVPMNFSTARAR